MSNSMFTCFAYASGSAADLAATAVRWARALRLGR